MDEICGKFKVRNCFLQGVKRGSVRDLFIPELRRTTVILWAIW